MNEETNKCEICGRVTDRIYNIKGYKLCSKHMHQLVKYGKFLDSIQRTNADLNDYIIKDNEAIINIYNRKNIKVGEFTIDLEDLNLIKDKKWRSSHNYIVTGNCTESNPTIFLSRLLLGITDNNLVVDHIDGNPMNNKKSNLRVCTQTENTTNKSFMSNNTSGFIGVSIDNRYNKEYYCPEIRKDNKRFHIGRYKTLSEAVYARYIGEEILFGEYRNKNKDEEKESLFLEIPIKRKKEIEKYVLNKIIKKGPNRIVPIKESNPEILKEWNFDKNIEISPETISIGSNRKVWWKCETCGFEYEASPRSKFKGVKCPCCSYKIALDGINDLQTTHPELTKYWDYSKNTVTPNLVTHKSSIIVWWECADCGESYQRAINIQCNTKVSLRCKKCCFSFGIRNSTKSNTKKVLQFLKDGTFIKEWETISDAARFIGIKRQANISSVCKGKKKSAYGFIWKYAEG